jgi:hypothetical protein
MIIYPTKNTDSQESENNSKYATHDVFEQPYELFLKKLQSRFPRSRRFDRIQKLLLLVDDIDVRNEMANSNVRTHSGLDYTHYVPSKIEEYYKLTGIKILLDDIISTNNIWITSWLSCPGSKRNVHLRKENFTEIYYRDFQKYLSSERYNQVKTFMRFAGLFTDVNEYYCISKECKKYQWNKNHRTGILYTRKVEFTDIEHIEKLIEHRVFKYLKQQEKLQAAQEASTENPTLSVRVIMLEQVKKLIKKLNIKKLRSDLLEIKKANAWRYTITIEELLYKIEEIKAGQYFLNECDDFGFRLHSILTTLPNLNKYFDTAEALVELDIQAAQMMMLTLLFTSPEAVRTLLKHNDEVFNIDVERVLITADEFKDCQDIQLFINLVETGDIYNYIAGKLSAFGYDRDDAKFLCFLVFFSNEKENTKKKALLRFVFPNLVEFVNRINTTKEIISGYDTSKSISKMMQRLESGIMIDLVGTEVVEAGIQEFYTVHDSYNCKTSDADTIEYIINTVFDRLKLKKPTIRRK